MLARIFPKQFDNTYRGHWPGLVIFVVVIALKAVQCIESVVNTRETAVRADGIDLASFSASGADTVPVTVIGFVLWAVGPRCAAKPPNVEA